MSSQLETNRDDLQRHLSYAQTASEILYDLNCHDDQVPDTRGPEGRTQRIFLCVTSIQYHLEQAQRLVEEAGQA